MRLVLKGIKAANTHTDGTKEKNTHIESGIHGRNAAGSEWSGAEGQGKGK